MSGRICAQHARGLQIDFTVLPFNKYMKSKNAPLNTVLNTIWGKTTPSEEDASYD